MVQGKGEVIEMLQQIIINIKTPITPEAHEKFEDKLKELLEKEGLEAIIDNLATGNSTVTDVIFAKELKKPDDIIEVHQTLENLFGE
ncbi:MAG: hypothetical protein Q8P40_14060 [Nitrospirota bacterium]|nr:hypothetical protein [Nitrospirota bacterium]